MVHVRLSPRADRDHRSEDLGGNCACRGVARHNVGSEVFAATRFEVIHTWQLLPTQ
jgi:hypothetical protein